MKQQILLISLIATAFIIRPQTAQACKCLFDPAHDKTKLNEAIAAVRVYILNRKVEHVMDYPTPYKLWSDVRVEHVYKGDLTLNEELTLSVKSMGDCSHSPAEGSIQDILIFDDEGQMTVRNQCASLSQKGWDELKNNQ